MELRQALKAAVERLTAAQVPSPRMNAELLIMFTLGCDRAYLYAHTERELTPEEVRRHDESLGRRASGIPAQYITGHQEFWGLDLIVTPAVLIPRPETEHVVEAVVGVVEGLQLNPNQHREQKHDQLQEQNRDPKQDQRPQREAPAPLNIVDVGTGSGAIALALTTELPSAEIMATDISAEALEVAAANAARLGLASRIEFRHLDLLTGLPEGEFDFVVSNPPYVGESEKDSVQLEVRKFEPRSAVFAGPTGIEVIERLIPQAGMVLKPGGWLVFEISGTIAPAVGRLLQDWVDVAIRNDLQGIPRVVIARKPFGA